MIREVRHQGKLLAYILTHDHSEPGLNFFTPHELSLQAGYMKYSAGHRIVPHVHNRVVREVAYTMEAIVIKSGRVRVDLYTDDKKPAGHEVLKKGDFILFTGGGHGFEFLEESEMIEVKQGPYADQDTDKQKFPAV